MKKIFILLCLIASCAAVGKTIYWGRNGFNICKIRPPVHTQFEIWNEEADLAFTQTYRFIGRGRQCFAFASEDGRYVLKLPRTNIYQIPLLSFGRDYSGRAEQERFILNSFKIAYEDLRQETGTVALHFGQTEAKRPRVTLIDSLGVRYYLPLQRTTFVLQYRHPILMKAFTEALKQGNRSEAEKILSAFIDVVIDRGKKGIWNRDESFLRNYGYDGERAYQIDIGSFYKKENGHASIHDTMHPVRTWLSQQDPAMLLYFDDALKSKL